MAIAQAKENLTNLFIKDSREALKRLKFVIDKEMSSNRYETSVLLTSRLTTCVNDNAHGTLSYEHYKVEMAQIRKGINDLINGLEEKEAQNYLLEYCNYTPILVTFRANEELEKLKDLLPQSQYLGIQFADDSKVIRKSKLEPFKILIFDNHPKTSQSTIPGELGKYLKSFKGIILYYGQRIAELEEDKYRDRVYFANSKFSIHSRLEELLRYLQFEQKSESNRII